MKQRSGGGGHEDAPPQARSAVASPAPWIALGVLLTLAAAAADLALGPAVVLIGLFSAGPLLAGLGAGPRATAAVGCWAIGLAFVLGFPDEVFLTLDHLTRIGVVALATAVSVRMAVLREHAHEAGAQTRSIVHSVYQAALDCIISMDARGDVVDLNAAAERTFGYSRDEAVGRSLADLIVPENLRDAHRAGLRRLNDGGAPRILGQRLEMQALRADGSEFPVELTITLASTDPVCYAGFIRDVTEARAAREELERRGRHDSFLADAGALWDSSLDYEATLEHIARLAVPAIADWAFVELVQPDGSIERVSMAHSDPAKESLVRRYDRQYPINPEAPEGSAKVIRTGEPELLKEIPDAMLEAVAEDEEHLRIMRELGFCSAMVVPLRARGQVLGDLALVSAESGRTYDEAELAMVQDLAGRCAMAIDNARLYGEARESERELRHRTLHDPLTGLPNRNLFIDRVTLALAGSGRHPGDLALLFFDLDGFKGVNDRNGHHAGDELLAAIPHRLQPLLRAADTVSRFAGDEFAVLVGELASEEQAVAIGERLIDSLREPFELGCGTVRISGSLGIAFARGDDDPEGLVRSADAAMYEVKAAGGNGVAVFGRGVPPRSPAAPTAVRLR